MVERVLLVSCLLTAVVAAQGKGGGGGGDQSGGGDTMAARALTPFEQFAGKLKIDIKTQGAAIEEIFADGAKEAGPVATQLIQLRHVNAELVERRRM